jgi:hypothetical protein
MSKGRFAQATINTGRVVTAVGASADFNVLTASSGTVFPLGISGQYDKYAQIEGYSGSANADIHAEAGDSVTVHTPGSITEDTTVLGHLGADVARGVPLMAAADGSGKLITATTGKWVVAVADQAGTTDTMIPVTPRIFFLGTVS